MVGMDFLMVFVQLSFTFSPYTVLLIHLIVCGC